MYQWSMAVAVTKDKRIFLLEDDVLFAALRKALAGGLSGSPRRSSLLSDREWDIFEQTGRGKNTPAIARERRVSPTTTESHRSHQTEASVRQHLRDASERRPLGKHEPARACNRAMHSIADLIDLRREWIMISARWQGRCKSGGVSVFGQLTAWRDRRMATFDNGDDHRRTVRRLRQSLGRLNFELGARVLKGKAFYLLAHMNVGNLPHWVLGLETSGDKYGKYRRFVGRWTLSKIPDQRERSRS